jgi:hypothetical protein
MSHHGLLVCLDKSHLELEEALTLALAPFDENMSVEPHRDYVQGGPADFWMTKYLVEQGWDFGGGDLTWLRVHSAIKATPDLDEGGEYLYDEDMDRMYVMSTYNPQSKWDWWSIGGRYSQALVTVKDPDPTLLINPVEGGNHGWRPRPQAGRLRADGARMDQVFWDAMRVERHADVMRMWDVWENEVVAKTPPLEHRWSDLADRAKMGDATWDEVRALYNSQPRMARLRDKEVLDVLGYMVNAEAYEYGTRNDDLEVAYREGGLQYATLTKEGQWMDPGDMGWFGMSNDTPDSRHVYFNEARRYVDGLDPHDWVVVVDVHI